MKYGDFQEPKPPTFPLFLSPKPNKTINLESKKTNFNDILDKKSQQNQESHTPSKQKPSSIETKTAHSLLQMSMIQQGSKQLSHQLLAKTEFIGKTSNNEGINNPTYINYAAAFQAGFNATTIQDIKRKKKELQDSSDTSAQENENEPNANSTGLTYSHNLNLFTKLNTTNPFKKLDKKNHAIFEDSPLSKMLNETFVSPLNLLGEDTFHTTKQIIQTIQKDAPTLLDAPDIYTDNDIETFEINANYHSIETPNENTPPQWKNWDENISAHYLLKRHADLKQYTKVIRQFTGKIKNQDRHIKRIEEQEKNIENTTKQQDTLTEKTNNLLKELLKKLNENPNIMSDPTIIESIKTQLEDIEETTHLIEDNLSLSDKHKDEFISNKSHLMNLIKTHETLAEDLDNYIENKALKQAKEWWNSTGKNINQTGLLLPFGLMAESAETIFTSSTLDLNQPNTTHKGQFNTKLIQDTAKHLNKHEFKQYIPEKKITKEHLMIDNITYGQAVFDTLKNQHIINIHGDIINFDPNNMYQDFSLESEIENNRIRTLLKSKIQGEKSFNTYDKTIINNHQKEDIKLIDPDNKTWDLPTLLTSIPTDTTSQDTFKQARKVYNILFDILETMAGESLTTDGVLKAKTTPTENGVTVPIYPNAEWIEYSHSIPITNEETNLTEISEGWEKVEGDALTITFDTESSAQDLFNTIKTSILHLEPLVSSFNTSAIPDIPNKESHYKQNSVEETSTRVLIDNQGELNQNEIISTDSPSHRYDTDIIAEKSFFQTNHWREIATYIKSSIIIEIGTTIFTKSQVNRLNKNRNKKKHTEYNEQKKQWEEKKYEEIKHDKKRQAKRKAKQIQTLNKYYKTIKKRELELKKELNKKTKINEIKRKEKSKKNKKTYKKRS